MSFKSYTTVVSSEAVTLYSSRTHEFLPGFWWSWRSLVFNVLFCLCVCSFSFDHCLVYHSLVYDLWLLLWYLQNFLVLFVISRLAIAFYLLLWLTTSDYPFAIFKRFVDPICQTMENMANVYIMIKLYLFFTLFTVWTDTLIHQRYGTG